MTRALLASVALAASVATSAPAHAAIFYVGWPGDRACDFTDVQAAIDHAEAVPGPDVIRLVHTRPYTAESLVIDDEDDLNLVGGYDHCADGTASGEKAVVEGAAGQSEPIVEVLGRGTVKLRFLELAGNTEGRGLDVACEGCTVQLLDVVVRDNAQGVRVQTANCWSGCPERTALLVGANVAITGNRSERLDGVPSQGAGIAVHRAIFDMSHAPGSEVSYNVSGGDGGGILLANASFGLVGALVIYNTAGENGGGIAVTGSSTLWMYPTGPGSLPRLRDNRAQGRGGALFVEGDLYGPGSSVTGWDTLIDGNFAEEGGAAYVASGSEGTTTLCLRSVRLVPEGDGMCGQARPPTGAVACPADEACNMVLDNVADYRGGAVMSYGPRTRVRLSHQRVMSNLGFSVFGHDDGVLAVSASDVRVDDSLIAENRPRFAIVLNSRLARTTIRRSTIANHGVWPLYLDDSGDLELVDSIVWEPDTTTLFRTGASGADLVRMVLAWEVESLGGPSPHVQATTNPGFVSLLDYRLRPDSPAVDFSDTTANVADLAGQARGVDLPEVIGGFGPLDLGAYELQNFRDGIVTSP